MSQGHLWAYLPWLQGCQVFPFVSCFWNLQCDLVSTISFDVWAIGKHSGDVGKNHISWFIDLLKTRGFTKLLKSRIRTGTQAIDLKIKFSFKDSAMHVFTPCPLV